MSDYSLIVSDPPHGAVDLVKAVSCFRLTRAEVQMKINYGIPEIWFAGQDRGGMEPTFNAVQEAGLNAVFVTGEALRSVPPQSSVSSFALREADLAASVEGDEGTVSYDAALIGVWCLPHREPMAKARSTASTAFGRLSHTGLTPETLVGRAQRRPGDPSAEAVPDVEHAAFLDLYVPRDGTVHRLSFIEGRSDLTGLGERARKSSRDNLATLLEECESRFAHARFDRRLMGMRIRRRLLVGEYPPDERRKGYSFASRALSQLLQSIAPGMKRITGTELSSRLAYLTQRERQTS